MASPSPSSSPETLEPKPTTPAQEPDPKTPSLPESGSNVSTQSDPEPGSEQGGEEGEEEEGECGFCVFMKGGGCKDAFIAWEQCVEDAEKSGENIVDKCFEVTSQLKKCMDAHADYYEPILHAEEALAESIAEEKSAEGKEEVGKEEKVEVVKEEKKEVAKEEKEDTGKTESSQ